MLARISQEPPRMRLPQEEVVVVSPGLAAARPVEQTTTALAAIDAALQVVLVLLAALTGDPVLLEQRLHSIEGLLVYQGLVPSPEGLLVVGAGFVDDPSGVIGIAQEAMEGGDLDFASARRVPTGWTATQSQGVQLVAQARQRVLAGRKQLEGVSDKMAALGIEADASDLAAIRQPFDLVHVAEFGWAIGAASLGLLVDAAADVAAGFHGLVLVVESKHALHEEGLRGVVADHRLGNRDNARSGLLHQLAGAVVVLDIARPAVQRPDDHVVEPGVLKLIAPLQLVQHLQKVSPAIQIYERALAGVAELMDDLGLELGSFVAGGFSLSSDGEPVPVEAGVEPGGGSATQPGGGCYL